MQLACVPSSGCAQKWVCVFCSVWLQHTVVAKWTSVNKLCADCIYLIHMLVNYTAVCCSWYVWKEKSLCFSLSEVQKLLPSQLECGCLYWQKLKLFFFCLTEHFADIKLFVPCISHRMTCLYWQYFRMFSVATFTIHLYHDIIGIVWPRSANFQLYTQRIYGLLHIL